MGLQCIRIWRTIVRYAVIFDEKQLVRAEFFVVAALYLLVMHVYTYTLPLQNSQGQHLYVSFINS